MGYVFQASPDKFDIDDYLSRYPVLIYWRTPRYAQDIAVGDRAFVWRAGRASGVVAIGTVLETPVPRRSVQHPEALSDDLWIAERPDPDEAATGIRIDEIRLGSDQGMVPRELVKNDPELGSTMRIRRPNASVFRPTDLQTRGLERLWGIAASADTAQSTQEGERRLRAHSVRERSPRLREDKLKQFRGLHGHLYCELCLEGARSRYPSHLAERVFEVHHRAPLAASITPVRTTLDDLAVLCANCHRATHGTNDVDANFRLLAKVPFAELTAGCSGRRCTPSLMLSVRRHMRVPHPFPEIYCDLNAEMIERGYSLERRGSVDDLAKLGLMLAQAVGMRFTFVMDDTDEHGNPDDIMFNGVVIHDQRWGYLAYADEDGVYWRSHVRASTSDA